MTAARPGLGPSDRPAEPAILVQPDAAAAARVVAGLLADALAAAAGARGRADLASTGGSTPAAVYRAMLAEPVRSRMPWAALHVWLGDDRFVRRGHPDCNMGAVDRVLVPGDARRGLPPPPLDPAHVHPWPTDESLDAGEGPAACAARFEAMLREALVEDTRGRPVFDAVLAGIGPDGHLLSIFPESAAWDAPGWATWAPAPEHLEPHHDRVTLTPAALDATPALVVAAWGGSKAAIVADLLGPDYADRAARTAAERRLPALRARRAGATWVLDAAAAAHVGRSRPTP